MLRKLTPGSFEEFVFEVEENMTAEYVGSGDTKVLATPILINAMETFCFQMLSKDITDGKEFTSVGGMINLKHLAPTPVGKKVTIKITVMTVDRRRIVFRLEARDETEKIAEGLHERRIVERRAFEQKSIQKLNKGIDN